MNRFSQTRGLIASLGLLTTGTSIARADVKLPSILSTHAVLQKSSATRIWGKADSGEPVRVTLGAAGAQTKADAAGRWQVMLDLGASEAGPFDLVVQGKNKVTVSDVLVGEAWLCAGQSNMQWSLRGDPREISTITSSKQSNLMLRQFKTAIDNSPEPRDDCQGEWTAATPADAAGFTAVGYFFGKKLQGELKTPVGLVHSSVPGAPIEYFMSVEAFATLPTINASRLTRLKTFLDFPEKLKAFAAAYDGWTATNQREIKTGDPAPFAAPDAVTADWAPMTMPGQAAAPGALWVRHTLNAGGMSIGKPATVTLGRVHDYVTIFWNGTQVAQTDPSHPPTSGIYKFQVAGELVKSGANVIALRFLAAAEPPGLAEKGVSVSLVGLGEPIKWEGDWLSKVETALPPISEEAKRALPKAPFPPNPTIACSIYNAMIAPVTPFTIRGITWYQGEANVPRAQEYRDEFKAMIEDYRKKWGAELPFYFCQLPNFDPPAQDYSKGLWAELRESQATALSLPKTGQAVLIDVGEPGNLHPFNKRDPGERLALLALAETYGKPVVFSGPVYKGASFNGERATVTFKYAESGLVAKPLPETFKPNTNAPATKPLVRNSPQSQLEGFTVCGDDQKWVPADATITGDAVVISSATVPKPIAVRYDWSDSPWGNLTNGAGLPAAPFRTDNQPNVSAKSRY